MTAQKMSAQEIIAFIGNAEKKTNVKVTFEGELATAVPSSVQPMAVATPTMLPVPIVADKAVQSAPKLLTSPSPSSSFKNINLSAFGKCTICKSLKRKVR